VLKRVFVIVFSVLYHVRYLAERDTKGEH